MGAAAMGREALLQPVTPRAVGCHAIAVFGDAEGDTAISVWGSARGDRALSARDALDGTLP